MKKVLSNIFLITMLLVSCEVETINVAFVENHRYDSPSDTIFSVLGIWSNVQKVADQTIILGEVRGDLVELKPEYTNSAISALANFEIADDTLYNPYRDYYGIINNCNYYLHNTPDDMYREGENVFERERAAVTAIRAWAYMQLSLNYGMVPFYTTPLLSFSDIEHVAKDTTNRKDLADICNLLIPELEACIDAGYPHYGNFTYGENYTINSYKFFIPIPLLVADMYLWRASMEENTSDFLIAAQYYHDYLREKDYNISPLYTNHYTTAEFTTINPYWKQLYTSNRNWDTERISVIPMATHANYGQTSSLRQTMEQLQGSTALEELADRQYYCHVAITDESEENLELPSRYQLLSDDSIYGSPAQPALLNYIRVEGEPQYARGDLRVIGPQYYEDQLYTINIDKYPAQYPHISTYRSNHVYLRLAEAICRGGFPETAFCILKYGLSRGNMLTYNPNELPQLLLCDYTFYDFGNNKDQIGLHARGCGNVEMDTLFYILPKDINEQEKVEYVEDLICDELALDCCFEGLRYYDLMRFAHRRGADYLASRIAKRSGSQNTNEDLRTRLQDKRNWYLPIKN